MYELNLYRLLITEKILLHESLKTKLGTNIWALFSFNRFSAHHPIQKVNLKRNEVLQQEFV